MTVERESVIEKAIKQYAERRGWLVYKFVSPGRRGVPDRMLIRNGMVVFLEIKRPGEKPTAQQFKVHDELRSHGAVVHWVDCLADAEVILL